MSRPLRVLVVEDEMMIAMLVQDMLVDLGHTPVGPARRLAAGIAMAEQEQLDAAILDVNLGPGVQSFEIADVLKDRGVPVLFATGYGTQGLADRFADAAVVAKPFTQSALEAALGRIVDGVEP